MLKYGLTSPSSGDFELQSLLKWVNNNNGNNNDNSLVIIIIIIIVRFIMSLHFFLSLTERATLINRRRWKGQENLLF